MADMSQLQAADDALKAEVAVVVNNLDSLFAAYQAAVAGGDQTTIDAVPSDIQADIDALKAAVGRDPAPAP